MARKLSNGTCEEYGEQFIQLLAMWDLSRADAYAIVRHMKYRLQNMNDNDYAKSSPIDGTGLTADKITEAGIVPAQKFKFN